jgi:hypothetical protein
MMLPLVGVLRGGIGLVRPEAGSNGANEAPPGIPPKRGGIPYEEW